MARLHRLSSSNIGSPSGPSLVDVSSLHTPWSPLFLPLNDVVSLLNYFSYNKAEQVGGVRHNIGRINFTTAVIVSAVRV